MDREDLLTSVFVNLRQRLRGLAAGILGNTDDADDALQDAFCRLWQRRERIASNSEAEALSVTTIHNICIDTLRKNARAYTVSIDENRDTGDRADESSADAMTREAMLARVEAIINSRLTPQQQQIIQMRDVEGISFEEIAEKLDMQPSAVRMALSRARKTIRDIYNEERRDDE